MLILSEELPQNYQYRSVSNQLTDGGVRGDNDSINE
jgi:hypothetical protein